MDPYRAPQPPARPPGDPMRAVLFIVGGLAALIAIVAIAVGLLERGSREATARVPEPTSDAPPHESLPPRVGEPPCPNGGIPPICIDPHPAPPPAKSADGGCNPPYRFGQNGEKIFKRECF